MGRLRGRDRGQGPGQGQRALAGVGAKGFKARGKTEDQNCLPHNVAP